MRAVSFMMLPINSALKFGHTLDPVYIYVLAAQVDCTPYNYVAELSETVCTGRPTRISLRAPICHEERNCCSIYLCKYCWMSFGAGDRPR